MALTVLDVVNKHLKPAGYTLSYDALTRLLRDDAKNGHRLQNWLDGFIEDGAVRYPDTALEGFLQLAELHAGGLRGRPLLNRLLDGPQTANAQTQLQIENDGGANALAIAPLHKPDGVAQLGRAIVQALQEAGVVTPPEDKLLTGEEAAALLACSPASLRKRVRPVLRGRWRRSDLLRYIAELGR